MKYLLQLPCLILLCMCTNISTLVAQQLDLNFPEAASYNPNQTGSVTAMDIDGNILFVGGVFDAIGGKGRANLGAIDLEAGLVMDWAPVTDGSVKGIVISDEIAYIWGKFKVVNGQPRNGR